jgi:uncharacterized protein (TIGR02118 family)
MIHYHYFITHKPSLSLEEFFRYWREKHPLAGGRDQITRRYIQSHRIPEPGGDAIYDGVAEVWWDNPEAMVEVGRTSGRKSRADEPNFIDLTRVESLATNDVVIKEQPAPGTGVKGIFLVKRRVGITLADFRKQWREVHGPQTLTVPGIRGLVQSLTVNAANMWAEPRWDAAAHLWFDDAAAAGKAMASAEMRSSNDDGLVGSGTVFFARENLIWS